MNVRATMNNGEQVGTHTEEMDDPFWKMALDAKASGHPTARVSMTTTHGIEYGEKKLSVTVSLECVQSKPHIDAAALLAFKTAVGYTNDGMSYLVPGVPPLATPP